MDTNPSDKGILVAFPYSKTPFKIDLSKIHNLTFPEIRRTVIESQSKGRGLRTVSDPICIIEFKDYNP